MNAILAFVVFVVIGTKRISEWFNAMAFGLREMGFKGVLLVGLCVAAASHPPLMGFSPSMTLIGFAYGLKNGILIGSGASLIGGAVAFVSIRASVELESADGRHSSLIGFGSLGPVKVRSGRRLGMS